MFPECRSHKKSFVGINLKIEKLYESQQSLKLEIFFLSLRKFAATMETKQNYNIHWMKTEYLSTGNIKIISKDSYGARAIRFHLSHKDL